MAISLAPPAPPGPHPTLLSTLKAYATLRQTRTSLLNELDQALSTFLSSSSTSSSDPAPSSSSPVPSPQSSSTSTSTCALEAISPPPPRSPEELEAVLRIAFGGLVEVKEEARILAEEIGDKWGKEELRRVVEKVEEWESERVKATLELYQLRRLVHLDSDLQSSTADSMREKEQLRTELAQKIQEEVQEITAEIADLSVAEEEEPATNGET
ncbi:hypothetical protein JCM11251_007293 [Rhodosporidiobolus azoricus]